MIRALVTILIVVGWYLSFYWGLKWNEDLHEKELEAVMEQSSNMSDLIYKEFYEAKLATVEERVRKEAADEFLDLLQTTCENSGSIAINNNKGDERFYVCKSATFL